MYWAELRPRSGSEQRGRRPVIIISDDGFNLTPNWRSLIVVPLSTSHRQGRRGPTVVLIEAESCGLAQETFALCHQITTLDRSKLTKHIGSLKANKLAQVEDGILAAVDIERQVSG